jgi:DNA-binding NtrC family response regulator
MTEPSCGGWGLTAATEKQSFMNRSSLHLRVLVVDAAQSMAQALSVILIENGYEASPANSAPEALLSCRMNWPDVVIIGALSGPMGGTQLAMQIVTTNPECRVLRITDDVLPAAYAKRSAWDEPEFRAPAKPINSRAILSYLDGVKVAATR